MLYVWYAVTTLVDLFINSITIIAPIQTRYFCMWKKFIFFLLFLLVFGKIVGKQKCLWNLLKWTFDAEWGVLM